jgi:adenylate cyclase
MDRPETERRLAAILSADVAGYSRLMAEDEAGTLRALERRREVIGERVRRHGGRVVDAVGDNLLAEFPSVVQAVECGAAIQTALAEEDAPLPEERRMRFRIGINLGDVLIADDRIYGDGVNVAARLEQLAEEGGVAISGSAFDQIEGKLDLDFEPAGEHEVKNLPRPVRVYRLRAGEAPAARALSSTVPGFSGRPAIAVLPFDNLSADPDREFFADGISEDLITRLSLWRNFPVIARNSSFVYKGRSVDLKRVGRELGARYVVEGSVRRAGTRVRISAQLIDAESGHHVWAERYDRELADVFALQDEISEAIVGAMHPELLRFESERTVRREPASLDAWECAQRARWHFDRHMREDNDAAAELFERAAELDPHLAVAWAGIAMARYWTIHFQWTDAPERLTAEMLSAARRAVALDDKDPMGYVALGTAYSLTGRRDEMLAAFERAVQLDPSFIPALFQLGLFLALTRRPDEAIERLERALRLSPKDPQRPEFLYAMAVAHFGAARYEEAADWATRSLRLRSDHPSTHRYLAASYAHLGRIDEARAALGQVLKLVPDFSLAEFRRIYASADPDLTERLFDGLRRAGLED